MPTAVYLADRVAAAFQALLRQLDLGGRWRSALHGRRNEHDQLAAARLKSSREGSKIIRGAFGNSDNRPANVVDKEEAGRVAQMMIPPRLVVAFTPPSPTFTTTLSPSLLNITTPFLPAILIKASATA
ncbi:hypothetical protein Q7P37_010937 [Cladosporium fusiforme]